MRMVVVSGKEIVKLQAMIHVALVLDKILILLHLQHLKEMPQRYIKVHPLVCWHLKVHRIQCQSNLTLSYAVIDVAKFCTACTLIFQAVSTDLDKDARRYRSRTMQQTFWSLHCDPTAILLGLPQLAGLEMHLVQMDLSTTPWFLFYLLIACLQQKY